MARKTEDGINYFPMNSDIVHNSKIKLVVAEFGPKAWAVLLPLYCKIYREKGYWLDWNDEDLKLLFAKDECQIDVPFVDEVITGCIRRGLFSKSVFDVFGVLTSDRIQENYLEAKRRNKKVVMVREFLVNPDDVANSFSNVNIIDLNVDIISKNVNIGTQNRRRRRIEGEGDSGSTPVHPPELVKKFQAFESWIKQNAPNVSKMKEPFTVDQYVKARDRFGYEKLTEMIKNMHNWKPLLQKNVSAYLTLINWSTNRISKNENQQPTTSIDEIREKQTKSLLDTIQ